MILEFNSSPLAICRLESGSPVPGWATEGEFYSITRTVDELSIVCDQERVPPEVKAEKNWRSFKIKGPLDFGLTGVLSSIAGPLADAGISLFVVSTFDTDYVLVRADTVERAVEVLSRAGHSVSV